MRKKRKLKKSVIIIFIMIICLLGAGAYYLLSKNNDIDAYNVDGLNIQHQFLTPNEYSRSQKSLNRVKGVVVHYTANPGSTAQNNHDYFENLKTKKTASVSSHFIIGLEGEIIQCIPLNEIAYASNNRNSDTISIECCHPSEDGEFTDKTYQALQKLVKALMNSYSLDTDDIIRHYDVTGKDCPKYFVEHPTEWKKFLSSL